MSVAEGTLGRYRAETPEILRERARRMREVVRNFQLRNGAERILAFAAELESRAKDHEPGDNVVHCSQ